MGQKSLPKQTTLSSTASLRPLYTSLICKRPLPTRVVRLTAKQGQPAPETFPDAQSLHQNQDSDSSGEETDSTTENRSFHPVPTGSNKNQRSKSGSSGSHSDHQRRAFSLHQVTNQGREDTEMPRSTRNSKRANKGQSRAGAPKQNGSSKRKHGDSDYDSTAEAAEDLEEELRERDLTIFRLQTQVQNVARSGSKAAKKGPEGTDSAETRLVHSTTKKQLFKICKFVKDNNQLMKATRIVMGLLKLKSLEGLQDEALVVAEETWIAANMDTVRLGINDHRNYIQNELHKLMFQEIWKAAPERANEVPTPKEILQLALRNGLGDKDPNREAMEAKFDFYWDEMMPKVSGHVHWSPTKRHTYLMSYGKQKDKDWNLVSPSDEAFLVLLWENVFKKWKYIWTQENKEGAVVDPEHEDMKPVFTENKKGVSPFGGWNKKGRKRYRELLAMITNSKKQDACDVNAVELACLARLRAKHKCDAKSSKKKKTGDEAVVDVDSDHEADWEVHV